MGCFVSREQPVQRPQEDTKTTDVTPLGKAVLANDPRQIRKILTTTGNGVDVNEPVNASGATALILAIYENKSLEVIRELVRTPGIDLSRTTPQGFFALSFAAEYRDVNVVRLLLEAGADVNQQSDASGWTALIRAMRHNRDREEALRITRLLVKTPGIDIHRQDASGWTALHHAARYLPVEFSRILVYEGHADVNHGKTDGWTPLMLATGSNECDDVLETVQLLATAPGADLERRTSEDEATALMLAASIRDAAIVRVLVDAGARVDAVDSNGWAAIHHCLRYSELPDVSEIVRVLLSAPHADVDQSDREGWTPLMYAARYRTSAEVRVIAVEFRASVQKTMFAVQ
jgi:ankyrin repeat protein